MEPPPAARASPRSTAKFFPRCFDFERLNVTTKKGRPLFIGGEEKCNIYKHLEKNPGYAYKKRARLALIWGPRMVNPALIVHYVIFSMAFCNVLSASSRFARHIVGVAMGFV